MKIPPPRRRRLPRENRIVVPDPPPGWRPPLNDDDTPDVRWLKLLWEKTDQAVWHLLFIVALKRLTRAAGPLAAEQLIEEYALIEENIRHLGPGRHAEAQRWLAEVFRALERRRPAAVPRRQRKTRVSPEMIALKHAVGARLVRQARREGDATDARAQVAQVQMILDHLESYPHREPRRRVTATPELAAHVFGRGTPGAAAIELLMALYTFRHEYLEKRLLPEARKSQISPLLRYLDPAAR